MTTEDEILRVLHQACEKVTAQRVAGMNADTQVHSLGLDSVQLVEVVVIAEQQLGVRVQDAALGQARTVADICAALTASACVAPRPGRRPAGTLPSGGLVAPAPPAAQLPHQAVGLAERRHETPTGLARIADELAQHEVNNPYFTVHDGLTAATMLVDGTPMTNFSSFDYLGLAADPLVADAAKAAIDRYGTSVSASRAVSGERPVHLQLEAALAEHVGTEDALVFVAGHATNVSVLSHLAGRDDLIVHDELAHNSIVQGAQLSGARRRSFPHNDLAALDHILDAERPHHRTAIVAVEGVYSMDGDLADLPELLRLCRRHLAKLYLDEAHSVGVLGGRGAGAAEHWQVPPHEVDVHMGTLSKALASCGGYIAGNRELITHLRHTAPGFIYGTGIAPSAAAAALAALGQLRARPQLAATARRRADLFRTLARERGLDTGRSTDGSGVVPIITGGAGCALRLADRMRRRGISVAPFIPPAVEESQSRLRFFVTAGHSEEQIREAVAALAVELPRARTRTEPTDRAAGLS
ncbi:aminotransferase class I/II-fold pyridoxal phosphate-dependent enzyme [Streptomyces sp. NPDC091272]|uniref:aminotransferase class I/II-fold pyridoxal phosphate-dependent enzyme n=1 Tax=Streptomyces sp. NPDC091272 TaxID=3365981 RepID=UPI0037F6F633